MSKIYVDEMPKYAVDCPFATYRTDSDGHLTCACKGEEYACSLEYDASCDYLAELPKD